MIRPILENEIPQLVSLHLRLLPNSLESKLGKSFVELFYKTLNSEPDFFCDGFFNRSQLIGFIVFSPCLSKVFRRILKKRFVSWASKIFQIVISKPRLVLLLISIAFFILNIKHEIGSNIEAEAIHLAILPEYRYSSKSGSKIGINIANEMHNHMEDVLKKKGVRWLKVLPFKWDHTIIKFVRSRNYKFLGEVSRFRNKLLVYAKDLGES